MGGCCLPDRKDVATNIQEGDPKDLRGVRRVDLAGKKKRGKWVQKTNSKAGGHCEGKVRGLSGESFQDLKHKSKDGKRKVKNLRKRELRNL